MSKWRAIGRMIKRADKALEEIVLANMENFIQGVRKITDPMRYDPEVRAEIVARGKGAQGEDLD